MRAVKMLVLVAAALALSNGQAAAQARGVIIQIPDDVAPGSPRPAPAPPVQTPPAAGTPTGGAPAGAPTNNGASAAAADPNAWHVLNTSNRTCLVLSKNDLKGGKDVRRLSALLPAPLFVVASGGCP